MWIQGEDELVLLSMKLPPPLRDVMDKPCPHGRLTDESPCFREEGTFLSAHGLQALGWVLEFLDFWIFRSSHSLSVVVACAGPCGVVACGPGGGLSFPDFHEFAYGVSRREILRGLPALWSLIPLSLWLWEVSRLYFPESLPAPRLSALGRWRMLVSCWSAVLDFGSVSLEAFLCSPPWRPFLFFGSHILSSIASALF